MVDVFKVVFVGDSDVGKTSIINQYAKGNFESKTKPTVGAHFTQKELVVEGVGERMKLQIWDTAGQEKY